MYVHGCGNVAVCVRGGIMKTQNEQINYPQGIKWTKQRKCVFDVLKQAQEPLNAHQIYNLVINKMNAQEECGAGESNYAVSTIYRILTAFEEKHLVSKSNWMDSGTFVYELERGQHTHYAVCLSCHKYIPLQICPLVHMHVPEAGENFKITGHKLELYGYCRDCRES